MKEYHKIQTVFKRDEKTKRIIEGDYTLPEFEYLADKEWIWTEKVNGTNTRVMWDLYEIKIGGKTENAQIPVTLLYRLQKIFIAERFQSKFGNTPVCLYGEGYGNNIQCGGNYIRDGVDFVLFDVRIGDFWLERENIKDIANHFGIMIVPIVGRGTLEQAIDKVRNGFESQWGKFTAEGLVLRPKVELFNRKAERIITKIKHRDFTPKS